MSEKPIQLEIFEQGSSKPKKRESFFKDASQSSKEQKFPKQICIKAVCFIVVGMLSFVVGVEKGKNISKSTTVNRNLASTSINEIKKTTEAITKITEDEVLIEKPKTEIKTLEKSQENATLSVQKYIIQLVTYKKDSSYINKEVNNLKQEGYNIVTIPSGNYMQICAGRFLDKQEAQIQLKSLKKKYKDCFIRKI